MVKALSATPKVVSTKASGMRTNNMAKALSIGTTTRSSTRETSGMVRRPAWVLSRAMAARTRVSSSKVCSTAKANTTSLILARSTRDSLKKTNPLVWVR